MTDVLMYQIDSRLKLIDGIEEVTVNLTFDPPWDKDMISEEGQLTLGLM
jgi:metal-sulfur cluster biosynthetic enzyme